MKTKREISSQLRNIDYYEIMIKGLVSFILLLVVTSTLQAAKYKTVIIDPGHGGKDQGARWGGVNEKDLNMKVAKKLEALLKAKRVPVVMTRRSDVFLTLGQRAAIANRYKNAIFVSIHFNAHRITSVTGVETFYASTAGKKIASKIQSRVTTYTKTRNRGIKNGMGYAVLNQTICPAVLVECGFISNTSERNRCNQDWYQALAAKGIYEGIFPSL